MPESPRIEELKRRVQVDPASIAFAALAEEYRRAGRFEDAIATCESGLQRHPAYLSARVTLGRALLELNRFDEARQELEHVLRAAPENLAAIRGLAEIHHRRGELPEALEQYRSALQVAKHDSEIEQAVDQISKQVTPHPEAAPPEPGPARKPIQLVTRPAPAPVPEPEPEPIVARPEPRPIVAQPEPEPIGEQAEPEPIVAQPEPEPIGVQAEPEPIVAQAESAEIESTVDPEWVEEDPPVADVLDPAIIGVEPIALAAEPPAFHDEAQVKPDPAVLALESFLAAILREKEVLTVGRPDGRR